MQAWDRHWYGPVAAIRVYLFQKCLVLTIACDLLVLMVERGARYGLDPTPFNVPHFTWLNQFHGLFLPFGVPNSLYYVCVISITSFLAFCLFFVGHRAWLAAIVAVLYTYAWSMSRLDSYLHHYMLSLILGCMVFFPPIDPRGFRDWFRDRSDDQKQRKGRGATRKIAISTLAWTLFALAVIYRVSLSQMFGLATMHRWIAMFVTCGVLVSVAYAWDRKISENKHDTRDCVGPTVSSWAFRLLGTTVGVIYVFTSIAKMDMEWCGGHTLRQVGSTEYVLQPVQQLAEQIGISKEWFWSGLATFVIPLELTLAAGYFVAVRQDEPNRGRLRMLCFCGWLLAIGLHLNNEMMNLIIQWFGYYMLMLAMFCLMPARMLLLLGSLFYCPESWARDRFDQRMASMTNVKAAIATGVLSMVGIVVLLLFGFYSWIAGCVVASLIIGVGLVLAAIIALIVGWERKSVLFGLVSTFAGLSMVIAVSQCSMRFDYYDLSGKTLQQLGEDEEAIREMELAAALPSPSPQAEAELHTNLGLSYKRMQDTKSAEKHYRRAIGLDRQQFLAHYGFANMLLELNRPVEAIHFYEQAVAAKSDFSDAWVNLGNALEFRNQFDRAIVCYETALAIEPGAVDIQQLLQNARSKQNAK